MNKKFTAVLICIAMMVSSFLCIEASAAECKIVQSADAEVTVTLKSDSDRVSLSVFPEGKNHLDLLAEDKSNYSDIMVYGNEFELTAGTDKTFVMNLDGCKTGIYHLYVSEDGAVTKFKFNFERKDLKRQALAQLNQAGDTDGIIDILDDYANDLGIAENDYKNADKDVIAEYILNSDVEIKEDDEATNKLFKSAGVVGLLASGKIENVYSEIDSFDLDETELDGWYDAAFVTTEIKENITERLYGKEISDSGEFYDEFMEAYILAVTDESDNYVNVKNVLDEFGADVGINVKKMDVKDYAEIAGTDFSTITELEKRIKALSGGVSDSGRPSGGGSGNSGGSGGSGVLRADEIETEAVEKLEVDIFSDIASVEWARESIVALAEKSIINGKGEDLFFPNDNITRYEFAKIAVLAFIPETETVDIAFTDVSSEHWAYEYVRKAFGAGLITGRDEYTFDGDGLITREEVAAILVRAAAAAEIVLSDYEDAKNYVFRDDDLIDDYAREAVYILKYDGVVSGIGEDMFAPDNNATRAEAAHMIYKLSQL